MMEIPTNEMVVLDIAGNNARVVCSVPEIETSLSALGFVSDGEQFVRNITDKDKDIHGRPLGDKRFFYVAFDGAFVLTQ